MRKKLNRIFFLKTLFINTFRKAKKRVFLHFVVNIITNVRMRLFVAKFLTIAVVANFMILFCGCKKEGGYPSTSEIRENICGKWKLFQKDGDYTLTNERSIHTYNLKGEFYNSVSYNSGLWDNSEKWSYYVLFNKIRCNRDNDGEVLTQYVAEFQEDYHRIYQIASANNQEYHSDNDLVFKRINEDFSKNIIGLWEGVSLVGDETFGDANHRWMYKNDNTYIYYNKVGDEWLPNDDDLTAEYFVDGDFFASRWTKADSLGNIVEFREWWDVESCDDNQMVLTALRERSDGSRYNTTLTVRKIE